MTASPGPRDNVSMKGKAPPGRALGAAAFVALLACVVARCFLAELPFRASALQFVPDRAGAPAATTPAADNPVAYAPDRSELCRMSFAVLLLASGALWALGGALAGKLTVRHGYLAAMIGLFAALSLASALGASNRRAALDGWIEQVSLLAVGFLAIQLCGDRRRFALLVAVLAAAGLALAAKGFWQVAVEIPSRAADFQAHRVQRLSDVGWDPNAPQALLIEKRMLSTTITGFLPLANPFGSLLLVLGFAAAGLAVDKVRAAAVERRGNRGAWKKGDVHLPTLAAVLAVLAAAAVTLAVILTRSRGAILSATLAAVGFAVVLLLRHVLLDHWRKALVGLAAAGAIAVAAAVAFGLRYDTLPGRTMTFRWHYWTASAEIFRGRPLLGVGPGNFATAYLQSRRDEAEEEIQMPHNVVVHALCQYGLPGGLVYVGILGCLLVGAARPRDAEPPLVADASVGFRRAGPILAAVAVAVLVGRAVCGDPSGSAAARALGLAALAVVLAGALLWTSWSDSGKWGIPPWSAGASRVALACGAAGFLVHNLVTYSVWMPSPAGVFYLAAGACVAQSGRDRPRTLRRGAWALASGAVAAVVAAGVLFWLPVARRTAHTADMLAALSRGWTSVAADEARRAAEADPLDAQAAADAAEAALIHLRNAAGPRRTSLARSAGDLAARAIERDAENYAYHRLAGNIAWMQAAWASPQFARAVAVADEGFLAGRVNEANVFWSRAELDPNAFAPAFRAVEHFGRAVRRNPKDSRLRIRFAELLCNVGRLGPCRRQLDEAIRLNGTLPADSVQKLAPLHLKRIDRLRARAKLLLELRDEKSAARSRPADR